MYNCQMTSNDMERDSVSWIRRLPFFYGWVILAVSGLGMFLSGPGQTYAVSLFVDHIIVDLGWSRTTVSGLYTMGSLTAATGMFLVGRLLDRFGARLVLPIVAIMFGCSLIFISNAATHVHLYLGFAFIRFLGQGSMTLIPTTLVSLWFVRLRGRVMALNTLGSVLSQALFPLLIHLLISGFGWRSAWVALALLVWALMVIPSIALVRRTPESVHMLPDGKKTTNELQSGETIDHEESFTLNESLKTRSFWLLLFSGSSHSLIGTALVFHHVSLMGSRGLDMVTSTSALSFIAPGALLGTFMAGFLCDKFPNRYVLLGGQATLIVPMVLAISMDQTWQAITYGFLIGLSGGILMTTSTVIWPNYFGRKHLGSIRGIVTVGSVGSAALGPLPFGFIYDVFENYTSAVSIFLALPIACGLAALIAVPPRRS